jgi:hypothetical protein
VQNAAAAGVSEEVGDGSTAPVEDDDDAIADEHTAEVATSRLKRHVVASGSPLCPSGW